MLKRHKNWILYTAAALVCIGVIIAVSARNHTVQSTTFVMDTVVIQQLTGYGSDEAAKSIESELRVFESETSRFLDDSYISKINAAAGKSDAAVNERVYSLLERGRDFSKSSEGTFDIVIGSLSSLWNINGENPSVPSKEDIDAARALVGFDGLLLSQKDGEYRASLTRSGAILDLGGIAKGYSLDIARQLLEKSSVRYGFISVGGNVLVYGDKDGAGFIVGVRYPEKDAQSSLCALRLSDTVVSTTGAYERYFEQDGVIYHHVLDPRTGYPANGGIKSVSVVDKSGLEADCMSTRLFVSGLERTLEMMKNGEVEAVVVSQTDTVYVSESLSDEFVGELSDKENYTFEFI